MIKKVYFGEYSLDLRRASSRYLWAGYYPVDLEVFVSKTFALSLLLLQARWRIGPEIGMAGERRPVKRPSLSPRSAGSDFQADVAAFNGTY